MAPIGAVVGEWVGSSAGLGYLMLHANGRMKTDLMFAALAVLVGKANWWPSKWAPGEPGRVRPRPEVSREPVAIGEPL